MRAIKEQEKPLIRALLDAAGIAYRDDFRVEDMKDGGMGSIRFLPPQKVHGFGVVERWFIDEDGVPVTATLNTDEAGQPAELDVWKVDFKPLLRWPNADELLDESPSV